jgi:hypothetical protein
MLEAFLATVARGWEANRTPMLESMGSWCAVLGALERTVATTTVPRVAPFLVASSPYRSNQMKLAISPASYTVSQGIPFPSASMRSGAPSWTQ